MIRARLTARLRQLRQEMAAAQGNLPAHEVDAMLAPVYRRLAAVERDPPRLLARLLPLLRATLCELELSMLPERRQAFEILGAAPTDDLAAIKLRYRRLAFQLHPDRTSEQPERIRDLNRAWEVVRRMKGVR